MAKLVQDAYIVAATRTPVGKAKGIFRAQRPDDLLAHVIAKLIQHVNIDKQQINDVIIGCAMPEAEQGMNVARISTLLAGLPKEVPAMTVNRFCASGLQTIALAAERIQVGAADMIIAGGVESMSLVPMGGNKFVANPEFFANHEAQVGIAYGMGITAEKVALQWKISRQAQDEFALQSHERAVAAIAAGKFSQEISAITITEANAALSDGKIVTTSQQVTSDQGPRSDTSLAKLAKLRSAFASNGSVTAGNSSQMSDGAGAVLVVSEKIIKQYNLRPLARFVGYAVAGVAPEIMGIGPVAAIPQVLAQTQVKLHEIDWIELNEAFAAQSLAVIQELHLDPAKVNPQGGAIALGHPLGATGSIRTATIVHGMQRSQLKYGLVSMCIGTGMGAAGLFENLH